MVNLTVLGSHVIKQVVYANYNNGGIQYQAIFVPHGANGKEIAEWLKENLHRYLLEKLPTKATMEARIGAAFTLANKAIALQYPDGGSTALIAFKWRKNCYLVNLGDSMGSVFVNGELSFSTKPHLAEAERERIEKAGGKLYQSVWRSGPYRLDGVIAISRGFGDTDLASHGFSVLPDIYKLPEGNDAVNIVLATASTHSHEDLYSVIMGGGIEKLSDLSVVWLTLTGITSDLTNVEFDQPKLLNESEQFPIANSMFFDERLDKEQSLYFNWWMQKHLEDWIYVIQLVLVLSELTVAGIPTVKYVIKDLYNSPWEECTETEWTRVSEKFNSVVTWRNLEINEPGRKALYNSCWILKEAVIENCVIEGKADFKKYLEARHAEVSKSYGKNGNDEAIKSFITAFNNIHEKLLMYMEQRKATDTEAPDPTVNILRISITAIRIIYPHFTIDSQTSEKLRILHPIITIDELEKDFNGKGLIKRLDSFGTLHGVSNLVLVTKAIEQLTVENNAEMSLRVAQFASV